ncbi:hypothetical protein JCM9279_000525 [Rhodotorula babjevae]
MSAPESSTCVVCDKPTTKACGACKTTKFCGPRCQALIWPTHKFLCGRDPTDFHVPPLTHHELAFLRRIKNTAFAGGCSLASQISSIGLDEALFWLFVSSASADHDRKLREPRTSYRLMAYRTLKLATSTDNIDSCEDDVAALSPSPWYLFGSIGLSLREDYLAAEQDTGRSPEDVADALGPYGSTWSILNVLLRHELVQANLRFQATRPQRRIEPHEILAFRARGIERAIRDVQRSTMREATSRPEPRIKMYEVLTLRGRSAERSLRDLKQSMLPGEVEAALIAHYRAEREDVRTKLEALDET